ncbi:hypothetical protein SAMN02799622_04120 [Methylobacterium sp. UNC378MF]|jgi:hypothetical protein|uniref:hypothetical protein n=1 Tax=Methylobacterium sp. UNC378MF TaxID=1502748 RepID=UPI000881B6C5|nr:hypothetical protein [Methylobacterium sp. UNC378MF]SDA27798.1 hypothetical protein SAMN02799622_04120 [Methylobacterium sp. UNC378MF]
MYQASTGIPTSAPVPAAAPVAYRAFFVAPNGRVLGMVPLEASCEAEARVMASELVADGIVELWAGLQVVARFEGMAAGLGAETSKTPVVYRS